MPRRRGVIGLGNPDRGDDAVGVRVVRALRGRTPEDVTLLEGTQAPLFVFEQLDKFDTLILVDAVRSDARAGTVYCFDGREIPANIRANAISSHGLSVHDAIGLGEALGRLPEVVKVVGIEAAGFDFGAAPSSEVTAAIDAAVRTVLELIRVTEEK